MKFPEQFRWKTEHPRGYSSKEGDPFGCFQIPKQFAKKRALNVIACDGEETGWEHVSVTVLNKPEQTPTWAEMCIVKGLFWDDEETVIQFHPPKSEYVNNHAGCLHLWRPTKVEIPLPPSILVGIKT